MADLTKVKGIAEKDRKLIEEAEALMGPEPTTLGFAKNLFWGNVREDLAFPYPSQHADETARCDQLLAALDDYLSNEHPAVAIDQDQEIPRWVIDRLFKLGVLGMTIPKDFGGGGFGITSYNRVLERIGKSCGSTAVMVSAHQSIGCKAVMLFGTEEQKRRWLHHLANDWLSAFCLSEPNVGCDAGGQETRCELSADGTHYILNGEKKWATSGALAGLFTVMCKQRLPDGKDGISALVCTPDMGGIDVFQKNRSKCGIRGTWQARIRFTNVRVPRENLLDKEGKGLKVALTCLNYGRCTLSAGMLGGAHKAMDQSVKWAQTRHQFNRPLSEWELVRKRIAHMAALTYAMDAVLYMTTGFLDRGDEDIMVETAICKTFCSEMGWRVVNDAMQIMGGESYMTENEIERIFRDSRINLIVEGSNDLMQGFVFGYGGKRLAESMLAVKDAVGWDKDEGFGGNLSRIVKNGLKPAVAKAAIPLGLELFLGIRRAAPVITKVHPSLKPQADRLCAMVREHSHQLKQASKRFEEKIFSKQATQARIGDNGIYLHAWACTLSKLDRDLREHEAGGGANGTAASRGRGGEDLEFARDKAAALHFFDLMELAIRSSIRELYENADDTMTLAAEATLRHNAALPNSDFVIPEKSPVAAGTGRRPKQDGIKQFPGDRHLQPVGANGRAGG